MEKKEKTNKILYIALSILIACCLWFYVVSVDDDDVTTTISNISVTFVGEERLAENNLMIIDGQNATVNLRIQCKRNIINRLNRNNITIQVDVSRLATAGDYSQAYDIIWPETVQNGDVLVLDRNPVYVDLTLAKRVTRSVEVRARFEGSVAENFQKGEFIIDPLTIEVSGIESEVNQINYALVTLREDELKETVQADIPFTLVGFDGEPLTGLGVTCERETVAVTLPVVMVKELALTVDFQNGGGAVFPDNVDYTITPVEAIVVSGAEGDLAGYDDINLGVIDLAKVISSDTFAFTVPLPEEVTNVSGVTEATVSVKIKGLVTKTLETSDIEIINVPEGVTAEAVTQSLQVMVRGTQEAIDLALAQHLQVVVDLAGQDLPLGQSVVTAKVTLASGSGAGVVGEYKVAVTLS